MLVYNYQRLYNVRLFNDCLKQAFICKVGIGDVCLQNVIYFMKL